MEKKKDTRDVEHVLVAFWAGRSPSRRLRRAERERARHMPSSVSRRRTRACASAPAGATRGLSTSPRCRQPVPRAAPHSAQSQSHGWSPATALPFFVRRRSPTARRDGGAVRVRVPRTLQPHAQNASCKHVLPFPAGPARRAGVRERVFLFQFPTGPASLGSRSLAWSFLHEIDEDDVQAQAVHP